MKVTVQGKATLNLTDRDYVTEGGEGKVYLRSGVIYKINHTPGTIDPAKIQELSVLDNPLIIRPLDLLVDQNGKPIGYTMAEAPKSVHMSRVFTTDFRNRSGITEKSTVDLVNKIRDVVSFVHSKKCLVVDMNENNFLVDEAGHTQAYFIDVYSYQTPSFPATAIMPNIRDYHANKFTEVSDWFSFGIIACQLFVGIHPYRGNHPHFKRNDFIERMKSNVSIFNPQVTIPTVVRDFSMIPSHYLDWFKLIFEKGERLAPPDQAGRFGQRSVPVAIIHLESLNFKMDTIESFGQVIRDYINFNGHPAVFFDDNSVRVNRITYPQKSPAPVVFTKTWLRPYQVKHTTNEVYIEDLAGNTKQGIALNATRIMVTNNRIYAINREKMFEITIAELDGRDVPVVTKTYDLLPGYTNVFDGILIADVLGVPYLIIPSQEGICHFVRDANSVLKGYRMVAGKYQNGVAILIGQKGSQLDRFIMRFRPDFSYDCRKIEDVDTADINFTVLPNGITVHIPEDGLVEIFHANPDRPDVKHIQDPKVTSKMRLFRDGTKIIFHSGTDLCSLSMK